MESRRRPLSGLPRQRGANSATRRRPDAYSRQSFPRPYLHRNQGSPKRKRYAPRTAMRGVIRPNAQLTERRLIYRVKQYGLRTHHDRLRARGTLTKAKACGELGFPEGTLVGAPSSASSNVTPTMAIGTYINRQGRTSQPNKIANEPY